MHSDGWVGVHSLVVAVLVPGISSRRGLVRLRGRDPDILGPSNTTVGREGKEPVGLDPGGVAAGVVERKTDNSGRAVGQYCDCVVEVIGVVGVVVDLGLSRPVGAAIIRMANVDVEIWAARIQIGIADEQTACVSAVPGPLLRRAWEGCRASLELG